MSEFFVTIRVHVTEEEMREIWDDVSQYADCPHKSFEEYRDYCVRENPADMLVGLKDQSYPNAEIISVTA